MQKIKRVMNNIIKNCILVTMLAGFFIVAGRNQQRFAVSVPEYQNSDLKTEHAASSGVFFIGENTISEILRRPD
jgi:hypothetical protein